MSDREPQEMAQVAAETGAKKAHRTWDRVLVSAFLAGAYISFGALVAITVSSKRHRPVASSPSISISG